MGYFKDNKLTEILNEIDMSLEKAMDSLNPNGGLINKWAFDDKGDIILFQEYPCGCDKEIGKIKLNIDNNELDVITEEEFIMQMEDILLEVNFTKLYDNLLFNVRDISNIKSSCKKCEMYV